MIAREAELAALIAEQEKDARMGHRVFSVSLNTSGSEDLPELLERVNVDDDGVARLGTARRVRTFRKRSSHGPQQRVAVPFDADDESDSRHGTELGYVYFGCRCDRCRVARTAAIRARPSYESILANQRALKERYRGTCRRCDGPTTGCFGPGKSPELCFGCSTKDVGVRLRGTGARQAQLFALLEEHGTMRYLEIVEALGYKRNTDAGQLLNRVIRYGFVERVSRGVYRLTAPAKQALALSRRVRELEAAA